MNNSFTIANIKKDLIYKTDMLPGKADYTKTFNL